VSRSLLAASFAGLALVLLAAGAPADEADIEPVYQALHVRGGLLLAQATAPVPSIAGQLQISPADEPPPPTAGEPVIFNKPLDIADPALEGKSLEELIVGSPIFPPIEGLDPGIWQKKNCGTCHQWTKERLCTQAKTYVGAEKMVRRLEHPYGLPFKQTLERWAEGGCL